MGVIKDGWMASYCNSMHEVIKWYKSKNYYFGCGRGSAAGCLISYLTNLTTVDPIKYNLLFERFYNADRKDVPDFDWDIEPSKRPEVVQYIQQKYGKEKFAQLSTYGTLQGKNAMTIALTTSKTMIPFSEQKEITKELPEKSKISGELQEQKEEEGTDSLVYYALKHMPKTFEKWCKIEKKKLVGEYSKEFQQAILLEKILVNKGRHASAFVLYDDDLSTMVPIEYDEKSKQQVDGLDMHDSEDAGMVKLDLLGLELLDKSSYIERVSKNDDYIWSATNW